jgi:hypothetical protein
VRVRFVAKGLVSKWTRHALERRGFEVDGELNGAAEVVVDGDGGERRWHLRCRGRESSHTTVESLTWALEAVLAEEW